MEPTDEFDDCIQEKNEKENSMASAAANLIILAANLIMLLGAIGDLD